MGNIPEGDSEELTVGLSGLYWRSLQGRRKGHGISAFHVEFSGIRRLLGDDTATKQRKSVDILVGEEGEEVSDRRG